MAQRIVAGNDILLFIDPAGSTAESLVVCLTSNGYSITNNVIDGGSKCGPTSVAGKQDLTVSFDGQLVVSPDALNLGWSALHDLAMSHETFAWRMGPAIPATGDVTISGNGFLASFEATAPQDDVATFTASLGVVGSFTKVVTP